MRVRIGLSDSSREIDAEVPDSDEFVKELEAALERIVGFG